MRRSARGETRARPGSYYEPPCRPVRRRRRGRPPGSGATLPKRAWELLALLRVGAGADHHAIRRDLGGLSVKQLSRVVERARRLVRSVGGDLVVDRVVVDRTRSGLPRFAFHYRVTVGVGELVRRLTGGD